MNGTYAGDSFVFMILIHMFWFQNCNTSQGTPRGSCKMRQKVIYVWFTQPRNQLRHDVTLSNCISKPSIDHIYHSITWTLSPYLSWLTIPSAHPPWIILYGIITQLNFCHNKLKHYDKPFKLPIGGKFVPLSQKKQKNISGNRQAKHTTFTSHKSEIV